MRFKYRSKSFSVRQNSEVSPSAEALLGPAPFRSCRSSLSFALIKEDMLKIGRNKTVINDNPAFSVVCSKAFMLFKLPEVVVPIHLNDIFYYNLDIRKSSPGIPWQPYFKTRGEVMDDPFARNSIRLFWHKIKLGIEKAPPLCKVLYTAHIQRDQPKIRVVYPTTITLMEACFALHLIDAYKMGSTPIAYGFDMAVSGAYRLRCHLLHRGEKNYGCLDTSGFNKTATPQMIKIAFTILVSNLDLTRYRERGIPRLDRLIRAWEYLVKYFLETPLVLGNGERWQKSSGIPSGSYFTQLIGSIVNWIVINYSFLKVYRYLPDDCLVFGDYSVVASGRPFSVYRIAEFAASVGMEINPCKSIYTKCVDEVFHRVLGIHCY